MFVFQCQRSVLQAEIYDHCVWEAAEWGIMKIDQGAISLSGHHWKHGLWPPPFSYH